MGVPPPGLNHSYCQVPVDISQKLDICRVRRPVSQDRRILAMGMEVCRLTHVANLLPKF